MYIAGMDPHLFWPDAVECRAEVHNFLASPTNPVTPLERATGNRPPIAHWRVFGCEAMSYVEKDKRYKFDAKMQRAVNLGPSPSHTHSTYMLYCLRSKQTTFRRHVIFNETSFPLRPDNTISRPLSTSADLPPPSRDPDPADLIGLQFRLDGKRRGGICTVTGISKWEGHLVADYVTARGTTERPSIPEVRAWTALFLLNHATTVACPYKGNDLALTSFLHVMAPTRTKTRTVKYGEEIPRNMKDASNMDAGWFQAEDKETHGVLSFDTWQRFDQSLVTPSMRKKALRAHRIYDIKRSLQKKNRLVINGNRQHPDTYTDTTCPVATLLEVKVACGVIVYRRYHACTGDSKNAYLHSFMGDLILIIIPEGFPGAGEVAFLRKALYGAKQSGRRYYDYVHSTLLSLGLAQCQLCPCLFRLTVENPATQQNEAAFILIYSDDNLTFGEYYAWTKLKLLLATRFEITYQDLDDFLGLDLSYNRGNGQLSISMKKFCDKFLAQLNAPHHPHPIYTPGLTNMKVVRGVTLPRAEVPDPQFRHKTGSLNWLVAGIRYDMQFATKELSRVADCPTLDAEQLLSRQLQYLSQTTGARLLYSHDEMLSYSPPPTRRKPTDSDENIYAIAQQCEFDAGIPQHDDHPVKQEYVYDGKPMVVTVHTDADLGGVLPSRQSTSGLILRTNGAIVHSASKTEKLVLTPTTASEFVSLNRGGAAGHYVKRILDFYGNPNNSMYYLYTDSQTAEHLATQPNMSTAGRALDIRWHSLKQKYLEGRMRAGGVSSKDNDADICTKYLHPGPHCRHARHLFDADHSRRNLPTKYLNTHNNAPNVSVPCKENNKNMATFATQNNLMM